MKTIKIEATKRAGGAKEARKLRSNDRVPCVIYGASGTSHFDAAAVDFKELVHYPGKCLAMIHLDGKEYKTIMKETQFHPVTDRLMHVDFLELTEGKPVMTELPVKAVGRAKGVGEGGKLMTKMRTLKVKLNPEHLVEFIEVDVTELTMGKSVRVGELTSRLKGIEILHSENIPIFSVETPRLMKLEAEEPVAVAGEAVEGAAPAEGEAAAEKGGEKEKAEKGEKSNK